MYRMTLVIASKLTVHLNPLVPQISQRCLKYIIKSYGYILSSRRLFAALC